MKARRSAFIKKMFKDPGFVKAFNAALNAAMPKDAAPESIPRAFEFDYNGAHYKFGSQPFDK